MDYCGGGGNGLTYVPDLSPRSPHDGTAMRDLGFGLDGDRRVRHRSRDIRRVVSLFFRSGILWGSGE